MLVHVLFLRQETVLAIVSLPPRCINGYGEGEGGSGGGEEPW